MLVDKGLQRGWGRGLEGGGQEVHLYTLPYLSSKLSEAVTCGPTFCPSLPFLPSSLTLLQIDIFIPWHLR